MTGCLSRQAKASSLPSSGSAKPQKAPRRPPWRLPADRQHQHAAGHYGDAAPPAQRRRSSRKGDREQGHQHQALNLSNGATLE